jgi:transposase
MSLKPMAIPPVPPETARVARAAFPKGNIYMKLRERIGTIIHDEDFVALFGGMATIPSNLDNEVRRIMLSKKLCRVKYKKPHGSWAVSPHNSA